MTIRVIPCPRCGAQSDYGELIWHIGDGSDRRYYMMCPDCEAMTDDCATAAEALDRWNRGEVVQTDDKAGPQS